MTNSINLYNASKNLHQHSVKIQQVHLVLFLTKKQLGGWFF